ncbi:MAG: EamA family transporter [Candidatus Omnitrophica bacterium]|nr:EamA family transporter [Candidatus Omnitrophota bacterium]MDD5592750.1 EamA family transporter [Candidatus Omnitrophota bacterium]
MFRKKITFKILLILISSDVLETLTHFCFKKSTFSISSVEIKVLSDILVFLFGVLSSPFLWAGLASVAATFIIWSAILSKIDLSVAVPVCSFSYIAVPLVSIIFLHEKISMLRWVGIIFILIGVIFVSLSSKEKEYQSP